MKPCHLPLVSLSAHETCFRCGRFAREHRGHPTYQEETMTETTEPTREQIEKRVAQLEALVRFPQYAAIWDTDLAVYRMALRTLDAEAKLAAMTERAEKAERECAEAWDVHGMAVARAEKAERELADVSDECATLRTDHVRMRSALVSAEARAEKAERERERDEARAELVQRGMEIDALKAEKTIAVDAFHDATRLRSETQAARIKAEDERDDLRTKLAEAERRIADLSPPTVPTTDERLDCEASSLLLLSTWARRVMMREKNRRKGVPEESVEELLAMARAELSEARCAIEENAPTDDILAELGDAAAIIAFAMREVESRRNR